MENNFADIRQKADELIRQAFLIWQAGNYSENLEQLTDDPVFKMLMTAMAYQFNEIDDNLEFMKHEVMNDFAQMFIPYNVDRVQPTTIAVETQPAEGVPEVFLDDSSVFNERNADIPFIPLFKTRSINSRVTRIVRLDGRRWKISVSFPEGVTNLAGFAFAIKDLMFRDFSMTVNNKEIPLIKPWNQYELPFTDAFSYVMRLYNNTPVFNVMSLCLELLAKQDMMLFCVKDTASAITFPEDTKSLDLVVEFKGIDDSFVLDKTKLHLNVNLLVNAKINTVTLTKDKPIARVSDDKGMKYMKLLAPSKEQVISNYNVYVRKVQGDRFNLGSLIRLLDCLVSKFHSDYYAFQLLKQQDGDSVMRNIDNLLKKLRAMASSLRLDDLSGVYLFLKDEDEKKFKISSSFDVRYLSSNGTLPEGTLKEVLSFTTPVGLDVSSVHAISKPVQGSDDKFDNADHRLLMSYFITTSDRLVTPADIRIFCQYRMMELLSLGREAIHDISVLRQASNESYVGYEIRVVIKLNNTTLVRKALGDRISRLECLIEKLIEVRSMNIYPIRVTIEMN